MSDKCPKCNGDGVLREATQAWDCGQEAPVCDFCGGEGTWMAADSRLAQAHARIAELEAIVAKLPKTADGVPAYKDMPVWCVMPDGSIYETELGWYCTLGAAFARDLAARQAGYRLSNGVWRDVGVPVEHCYSTREAAEAAKEAKDGRQSP